MLRWLFENAANAMRDTISSAHTVRADERDLYLYSVPYGMYFFGNKRPTAGVPDIFRGGEDGGTTGTMHLCNWSVVELQVIVVASTT